MASTADVKLLMDYNLDLKNNRIYLQGDINETMTSCFIKGLNILVNETDDAEIFISSNGGDEYEAFAIHDAIVTCNINITTIGYGKVMSAAPLLLTCGDVRKCTKNCWFMVHEASYSMEHEKHTENFNTVKHIDSLESIWFDLMDKYTKTTKAKWKRLCQKDYYFKSDEAIKLGLIDEII